MLKALLWDVDGTLAETERDGHRVAFNLAFAEAGLDWGWTERRYGELLETTGGRERILADMAAQPGTPVIQHQREALAQRLHGRKNQHYAALVAEGRIQARPGVVALIREAAAAGLVQAIVTTTSRSNVQALLPMLLGPNWAACFSAVLCGEDTVRKKPDPEVYTLALQRLGLAPHEALAIEDSTPGARAAQAAGVPLVLRPSVYFPADAPPAGITGQLCGERDRFDLAQLRQWHGRLAAAPGPSARCAAQRGV
jgi:HAD superfamily hydrolase (TIGR01509 family)